MIGRVDLPKANCKQPRTHGNELYWNAIVSNDASPDSNIRRFVTRYETQAELQSTYRARMLLAAPTAVCLSCLGEYHIYLFIGAREANPWLSLFEPNLNFVLSMERENKRYVVFNRKPQLPEPAEWISTGGDQAKSLVFSLVTYLPNLDGKGNVLILEGDTIASTECAWDFVNDSARFLPFLKSIRSSGTGPSLTLKS